MRAILQIFAAIVQATALLVAMLSLSDLIEDKGRAANASQDAIRADIAGEIGRTHFEQAEQEERAANASASEDAVALGLATTTLLLALLANIAGSLIQPRPSAELSKLPSGDQRPQGTTRVA